MIRFFIILYLFFVCLFHQLIGYELCVVSMFRNCAPYIREWVEYHKMVGVDHFWLYNDASTDEWEKVLQPYIDEGIVEVFYWPARKPSWVAEQLTAFIDGLTRAQGKAKWVALIDQDEFLLPMQDKTVTDCLNNHFSDAEAIYVNWRHFGTNHVTLAYGEPFLFRLTACAEKGHPFNAIGKSIVKPDYVRIDEVWYLHHFPLKQDANYYDGSKGRTIKANGIDWKPDGRHHGKYIRINHYAHRDEPYFHNYRLPRDSNKPLMLRHYKEFNLMSDYKIIDFIKNYHKETYEKIWK